jgi:PBP1b-binding outer membrane lipoprotein LpoB
MARSGFFRFVLCVLLVAGLFSGCATGVTQRVDLDSEIVDDGQSTSVQDYRTVSDQMARSLVQLPFIQRAATPPTIAFLEVENRTNRFIDTVGFQEKIRTNLLKNAMGRFYFLDRSAIEKLLEERKRKEKGVVSASAKSSQAILGADYFLTGSIHSINRVQGTQRTEYTRYSFRLTDADTSLIVWEDEYETRYFKSKAFMDQ